MVLLVVSGCEPGGGVWNKLEGLRTTQPILFVGDFTEQDFWHVSGTTRYFERIGLGYGGDLVWSGDAGLQPTIRPRKDARDFYVMRISDYAQSLTVWSAEIRDAVLWVRRQTGARAVTLVGIGTGGVGIRKYLVDHQDDHYVSHMIMVASPNGGMPRAIMSIMNQETRGDVWHHRLRSSVLDVAGWVVQLDLKAPILRELLPVEHNPALQQLNATALPADVWYTTISLDVRPAGRWKLGGARRSLKRSLADVDRQDPKYVGGLHAPSVRQVSHVSLALESTTNYEPLFRELVRALSSPFELSDAVLVHPAGRSSERLDVYYEAPFAGLIEFQVEELETGVMLPVSRATIVNREGATFGRVSIGLETPDAFHIRVYALMPDGTEYVKDIIHGNAPSTLTSMLFDPQDPLSITVVRIENIPPFAPGGGAWDVMDFNGGHPDLQISMIAGSRILRTGDMYRDVQRSLEVQERFELNVDPDSESISIQVRDRDPLGADLVGTHTWQPGQLPVGQHVLVLENGVRLVLYIDWKRQKTRIVDPIPLKI